MEQRRTRVLGHRPSPSTVLSLIALTVALGGVGYAAIPDVDGAVNACYVERYTKSTPTFRVIDPDNGGRCRNHEKELSFNQHGPTGPTGATGLPGPPGGGPLSGGDVHTYTQRVPLDTTAALVDIPGFLLYTLKCEDAPGDALKLTWRLENTGTATLNHVDTNAGHEAVSPGSALEKSFSVIQPTGYSWLLPPDHAEYVASEDGQAMTQHLAVSAYPDISSPTACDVSSQAVASQ